jgi:diacylglycerol kinase
MWFSLDFLRDNQLNKACLVSELAKHAKDAGAALVFVSFAVEFLVWFLTLYISFFA